MFSGSFTSEFKRSEARREFVLRDTSMGGEPGSLVRSVALAGVHVNVPINVFAVTTDDVFTSECVVLVKWVVRSKAVSKDSQRFLVAVSR